MNFSDNEQLEKFRVEVQKILNPIKQADLGTRADKDFLFKAQRTDAGRNLPDYYLVYFLLVELLRFKNLGKFEKVSWSVPIDFNGEAFLIEHRKFGVGIFAHDAEKQNTEANEILKRIKKAVKYAAPYFEFLAMRAAMDSKLNVKNNSSRLFERYVYFLNSYRDSIKEAELRNNEKVIRRREHKNGSSTVTWYPAHDLRRNAKWLALAAIDSFFCWTEHIFIHLAILRGKIQTGEEVADLAEQDWQTKYKRALGNPSGEAKKIYDQIIEIRRQLRNYIAHGAFGKQGEAFSFHSGAGAVPLLLPHKKGKARFSFGSDFSFDDDSALEVIEKFIDCIWSGECAPAELYIQQSELPSILTFVKNGDYHRAMSSIDEMKSFVEHLSEEWDRSANMDF